METLRHREYKEFNKGHTASCDGLGLEPIHLTLLSLTKEYSFIEAHNIKYQ